MAQEGLATWISFPSLSLSFSISLSLFPSSSSRFSQPNQTKKKTQTTITEPFLSVAQPTPPSFPLPFFFLACARPAIPSPSFARAIPAKTERAPAASRRERRRRGDAGEEKIEPRRVRFLQKQGEFLAPRLKSKVMVSWDFWGFCLIRVGCEKLVGFVCLLSSVIDDYSLRLRIVFEFLVLVSFWPNV